MHGFRNDAVDWNEANLATLKQMWAEGHSYSTIAAKIPNCTRSAAIGKIHRLKLPQPAGKLVSFANHRPRTEPAVRTPRHVPLLRRNQPNSLAAKLAIAEAEPGITERLMGEKLDGTGVKFADLKHGQCKWPRGEPSDADFEFSGCRALPDLPYCVGHSKIAYQTPQNRDRADKRLGV